MKRTQNVRQIFIKQLMRIESCIVQDSVLFVATIMSLTSVTHYL